MIKKIAWNTFKNTGNINTFIEYKRITNLEKTIKVETDETNKSEGNSNCRKNSIRL